MPARSARPWSTWLSRRAASRGRAVGDREGRAAGDRQGRDGDGLHGDGDGAGAGGRVAGVRAGRRRCAPARGHDQRDGAVADSAGRGGVGEGDRAAGLACRHVRRAGGQRPGAVGGVDRDARRGAEVGERAGRGGLGLCLPGLRAGRRGAVAPGPPPPVSAVGDRERRAAGDRQRRDGDGLAGDGEGAGAGRRVARVRSRRRGCAPAGRDDQRDRAVVDPAGRRGVGEGDRASGLRALTAEVPVCEGARAVGGVDGDARRGAEVGERAGGGGLGLRLPGLRACGRGGGRAGPATRGRAVGDREGRAARDRQRGDGDGLAATETVPELDVV